MTRSDHAAPTGQGVPTLRDARDGVAQVAKMNDYILFMHDDVPEGRRRPDDEWASYFAKLREAGAFQGEQASVS